MKLNLQKLRGHALSHREQAGGYLWGKGWWQGILYKSLHLLKRETSYALFMVWWANSSWQNGLVYCIKKYELNTNVKQNLFEERITALGQNTRKAALKVERCWRPPEVRVMTGYHQLLFYAENKPAFTPSLQSPSEATQSHLRCVHTERQRNGHSGTS